jgi:hypothetical protein
MFGQYMKASKRVYRFMHGVLGLFRSQFLAHFRVTRVDHVDCKNVKI